MRKYFLSIVALAAGLFATSCQESIVEPQIACPTTFTVQVPGQMGTKATPYNGNVNKLYVQVYPENVSETLLFQPEVVGIVDGFFTVSISLIQDQRYDIIFWAQEDESYVKKGDDLRVVSMKNHHNSETGAAFFAYLNDFVPTGTSQPVTLKRPFAQLNLGTTEASLNPNSGEVFLSKSKVKVSNVATEFNTVTGMGQEPGVYETTLLGVPQSTITVNSVAYQYISMDYLPIVGDDQALVTVAAEIELTNEQVISHEFTNVPVRENYRTNIVGNLISSTTDFNVVVDAAFAKDENGNLLPDNDYLVVDNVADANTELSNGADHIAINMIESVTSVLNLDNSSKETLYIQLPDADATLKIEGTTVKNLYISVPNTNPNNPGLDLTINTPNAHVELNGSGNSFRRLVATTSSNTLVLSGVVVEEVVVEQGNVVAENGTIVENLKNESTNNQSISVIVDENSEVNVGVDQDIVVLQGSPSSLEVATAQQLYEAISLIEDGGTISIEADIVGLETVVEIDKNLKILGNGMSISSSSSRVIRITKKEVEVVINDLDIISTAVRVGTNDIRGISIDSKPVEEVSLTLNNCSVHFNDDSACDWSYGVNFTGGTTNTLIINGGVYEGANAINLNGDEHEISIEEAELTSIYSYNEMYFGQCIRLSGTGSVVNVKNTIFNGDHAVAIGGNSENEITVEGNTDNTKYAKVKAGDAYCYSLEEAIGSIESEGVIILLFSIESDPVTIPNGKTITLNLNGKTITGVDNVETSFGLITNTGNLNISGEGKIYLSAKKNRGWNAYSSVISNQPGGNLTVGEGVVIEHLGGTDMAYGIDNLTNGKGTSAITTINGATVKSTYRAIRQFLNGIEANNSLTVNSNAVIEGANKSIWMQDPSANPNTGTLVVNEGATLKGDVYLFVCAGSTEWPVSVSIAASTVKGEVLTGNVPAGYEVVEVDGVWTVRREVSDKSELSSALAVGGLVVLGADIEVTEDLNIENVQVILDLNGKTITATKSNAIVAKNGAKVTLKNGNISAYEAVVRAIGAEVIIESGNYTQTGTAVGDPSTYRYAIDSREGGKITIDGGEFTSGNGMINVGSAVEINGGKFTNIVEKTMTRHFAYVSSDLTINGGEFYGKANPSAGGCFFCGAAGGCDIQINGGKFTSLWTSGSVNRIFEVYYGGIINVTGGLFNTNGGIATFVTENTDEATKADYPYVAK